MLPELAHLLLILALLAAAVQSWAGLAPRPQPRLAHVALVWQAGGIAIAFALLGAAFVQDDFSVTYVVQHGHSDLPLLYKISAIWGGHEGSLLLWVLILAGWSALAAWRLRTDASQFIAGYADSTWTSGAKGSENAFPTRVLGVLGLVSLAMLAFILFTSNPFTRLLPAADEGQSLNPLLQDPGLALHPPLLYLGYVGTAVPFAMVMAVLAYGGHKDWIKAMRPFVLLAWAALSVGIALGSWWAYYELGWGGWWFWDPVENASFMPWLVLAALAHTLAVREGRRALPHWTAVLAIGAFMLSLLGLFLVRSGVITSVHAFATDPRRGVFLLGLIAAFLLGAMALYARHAHRLLDARGPLPTALASRETAVLLNNLLLIVACATVLLGTLYPLALDALRLGKISVGPPYFEAVLAPVFLLLLALLAPVAWLRWGAGLDAPGRRRLALWGAGFVLALGAAWGWLHGFHGGARPLVVLTLALAIVVGAATKLWAWHQWRKGGLTASQWGMTIAHLGVAVFAIGVAMVGGYGVERDVRLVPGNSKASRADAASQTHAIDDCRVSFERIDPARGPNYMALAGHFTLVCQGSAPVPLKAEKRNYVGSSMPMTESAIRWGLTRDVYVALGEPLEGTPFGAWSVRVQHKPFMRWVWAGALLMALGAACAALSRRYRRKVSRAVIASGDDAVHPMDPLPQPAVQAGAA
ncbi:heme lyase CcmF/NrfE family subunit [Ottowia testudinis]|uniref:Heme lyase CcmF/NrfE family subunit n=1 Tax=Ottowia testudinis TaxID=2816950 RepID=A0A975H3K0_9BURK|nr:heme lyase CcmF/NrfE family subunit [Ottowia testudinis]QTD45978.1 heme lyase CcmF/NrfE family subunit [Ottowia testudinis]